MASAIGCGCGCGDGGGGSGGSEWWLVVGRVRKEGRKDGACCINRSGSAAVLTRTQQTNSVDTDMSGLDSSSQTTSHRIHPATRRLATRRLALLGNMRLISTPDGNHNARPAGSRSSRRTAAPPARPAHRRRGLHDLHHPSAIHHPPSTHARRWPYRTGTLPLSSSAAVTPAQGPLGSVRLARLYTLHAGNLSPAPCVPAPSAVSPSLSPLLPLFLLSVNSLVNDATNTQTFPDDIVPSIIQLTRHLNGQPVASSLPVPTEPLCRARKIGSARVPPVIPFCGRSGSPMHLCNQNPCLFDPTPCDTSPVPFLQTPPGPETRMS